MIIFSLHLWLIRSNRCLLLERASGRGRGVRQRGPAGLSVGVRLLCNAVDRIAFCISSAIALREIARQEITCCISKKAKRSDRYALKPAVVYRRKFSLSLSIHPYPIEASPARMCVSNAWHRREATRKSREQHGNAFLFFTRDIVTTIYGSIFSVTLILIILPSSFLRIVLRLTVASVNQVLLITLRKNRRKIQILMFSTNIYYKHVEC